jgi:hypothetical protein
MIADTTDPSDHEVVSHQGRLTVALGATDWLSLAAAPTFAIMALLTGVLGGGPLDMLCSAAQDASPLNGMVPMYLLMSAFHSSPWLKLISRRRTVPTSAVNLKFLSFARQARAGTSNSKTALES